MTYIVCLILTPLLTFLAEAEFKKKNKEIAIFYIFLAILIPSIVAGIRSFDVGRDISAYVIPVVDDAVSMDFIPYITLSMKNYGILEMIGYKFLIYIFAHIMPSAIFAVLVLLISSILYFYLSKHKEKYQFNMTFVVFMYIFTFIYFLSHALPAANFSMFMLQFLTLLFVYLFAYKNKDKMSVPFVIIVYMLVCFCVSLTFMRQCLAISVILYSTTFFEKKKYFRTLLLYLMAASIHRISLVSLIIYIFMFISQSKLSPAKKKIIYLLYIGTLLVSTLFFEQIVYFFTEVVAILPPKYYNYARYYLQDKGTTQYAELIFRVFFLFSALLYAKFANKHESKIDIQLILLLLFTDLAAFLISYKVVNADRIGFYFLYLGLFYLIPNISRIVNKKNNMRPIFSMFCIIFLLCFWTWKFPIKSWCETFPYKSDILTFLH